MTDARRKLSADNAYSEERLAERVARLEAEVQDWRECARYDQLMEGPQFKGWNRSELDRCRKKYIEDKV